MHAPAKYVSIKPTDPREKSYRVGKRERGEEEIAFLRSFCYDPLKRNYGEERDRLGGLCRRADHVGPYHVVGDDGDDGGDVVDVQVGRAEGEVRAAADHRQEHDPFQNRHSSEDFRFQ